VIDLNKIIRMWVHDPPPPQMQVIFFAIFPISFKKSIIYAVQIWIQLLHGNGNLVGLAKKSFFLRTKDLSLIKEPHCYIVIPFASASVN
jgi:hypothetical protein